MVGLLHQLVYIERGVDHDQVDKIINHSRNAVDTANPVLQGGRALGGHRHFCSLE